MSARVRARFQKRIETDLSFTINQTGFGHGHLETSGRPQWFVYQERKMASKSNVPLDHEAPHRGRAKPRDPRAHLDEKMRNLLRRLDEIPYLSVSGDRPGA
jgi:hypothetical protein